ncbi:KIF1-binding protein homolog [Copidosoma floridanum]|uniref:KIF1-binding protein homolog n=1 Tax=Copidosoma floridanum TaxID=29053 RepID=UPI0006C98CAC|nr:KIF1-binding protein homolog [Copidosoma floridanum]XP_014208399.1 KIF1-binding protein homolog [Copidosoma floridanum]XP_014208400.1 KIF1-binding protein homolog [Copidosoma floridanum]
MTVMGDNKCISDNVRSELKEMYMKVKKLLDENDPETEPYKSKYAAMEILKNMQNLLLNSVDNAKQEENEVISMLAIVYLNQGIVAIETEELKSGQDYLNKCFDLLSKNKLKGDIVLPMISALNQLGILWSKRDEATKAQEYLEQAETIYKNYKNSQDSNADIMSMSNFFGIQDFDELPAPKVIEKLHTLTLYYLAQIYGSLDNYLKSAVYCHMTLRRQLEMNDFDSIDWALNAATLSQFFMEKKGFRQARHHLAAATYILGKHEDTLKDLSSKLETNDQEKEILDSKWENFKHRSADISRCWAKYGILLMSTSRDRLISSTETGEDNPLSDSTTIPVDSKSDINQETFDGLKFETIENDIEHITGTITDKYLLDFNDAKAVFLNVQKWLNDAKSYYTMENHASDYVQIVQDISQLYKYLTFFEDDEDRQAKMHKRRIDLLEEIVKELNERYYLSVCQQIWIELGETYSEILDIKLDKLKATDDRPTPHALTKINNLTNSAIQNHTKFLDSMKDLKGKSEKFPEEMLRAALYSYFHLGRLYNKFITPDKHKQLEYAKKSLDAYTFLVNYCEKDPKAAELMAVELNICKDFMKLLPVKICKLNTE